MMSLIVVADRTGDSVAAADLSAVSFARRIAEACGVPAGAVLLGGEPDTARAVLAAHGVGTVHHIRHELLEDYNPEAWGAALLALVGKLRPITVLAAATDRGNEVMAQLAARAGLPLATNCVDVDPAGEAWTLTRQRWGGLLYEDASLEGPVKLLTVVGHAVDEVPIETGANATLVAHDPALDTSLAVTRATRRTTRDEGVTLAKARVVVAGGRGVGSAEGFAPLEALAALLGGAVGCSRIATNNGWRPHRDQVGQTGTKVAPELYIACGISGAVQHWVGCMQAKQILAINTDPDAAMIQRADYAVIGDIHEVLPAIIEEIRRRPAKSARA